VLGNRVPELIVPYVSASQNPLAAIDNFTVGAGNIAEISGATNGAVSVKNDTCADYYLRLVVLTGPAAPTPAPASVTDGGAVDGGGDGSSLDASKD